MENHNLKYKYNANLGHYTAASNAVDNGMLASPSISQGAFHNVAQGLTGKHAHILANYWQYIIHQLEVEDIDFKNQLLPLARIKKVMKCVEDVKMISAEAPLLFAKGCEIFITELVMRAWVFAEKNKRKTLQRSDISSAITGVEMFDFLIDIVPRGDGAFIHQNKLMNFGYLNNSRPMNFDDSYTRPPPSREYGNNFESYHNRRNDTDKNEYQYYLLPNL